MRRHLVVVAVACVGLLAACNGGENAPSPTNTPAATPTAGPETPTSQAQTPDAATPTSTATVAENPGETPTPEPSTATATTAPPTATPTTGAQPATQVVVPPTPTPPPASNNPMNATIGAAGTSRFVWSPANVKVAVGGTVTWTWNEPVQPHNVAGNNFPLGPTDFKKVDTVSYTFTSAGTYTFVCQTHPDTMRGSVTVE